MTRALRRVPVAMWACAALAFVNGAIWAFVTPPFQVPDETAHVGYVQYVGEWGDLPSPQKVRAGGLVSDELAVANEAVPFSVEGRPNWSPRPLREFRQVDDRLDRRPGSVPPAAINNPPLYYVVEAVPYRAARGADVFDRLLLMRLLSALLAAVTVACSFMFVRELLPDRPWTWTVGALAVAFQPMFGFMSGGVNNDNLLYALAAALIFLVARALRRGVTTSLAVALGLVTLAGMLTKTSFLGLVPGALLGLLVALLRTPAPERRRTIGRLAVAGAVAAIPFAAWLVANGAVFDRSGGTTTGGFNNAAVTSQTSLRGHASYIWQSFLPRLPGMQHFDSMGVAFPLWDFYIQGFVGRFGWWRFGFPLWVNQLGLGVYIALVVLAGGGLYRVRGALRRWGPELVTFLAIAGGYVLLVSVAAYRYQAVTLTSFEQARYLLPLLPFYGVLVAVAATAAGRRWGPALGALLVVLAMTHSLFAMLLVIEHYYA